jgi:hypothetical protein
MINPNFLIFLDIDGVLNPFIKSPNLPLPQTRLAQFMADAQQFDPSAVNALENLIQRISASAQPHIILSSAWRRGFNIQEIREIFKKYTFAERILDKTPDTPNIPYESWKECCAVAHFDFQSIFTQLQRQTTQPTTQRLSSKDVELLGKRCRASEIKEYLNQHPEFTGFVILDDEDSHLSPNFPNNFVSTANTLLFTPSHATKAYSIFQAYLNRYKEL